MYGADVLKEWVAAAAQNIGLAVEWNADYGAFWQTKACWPSQEGWFQPDLNDRDSRLLEVAIQADVRWEPDKVTIIPAIDQNAALSELFANHPSRAVALRLAILRAANRVKR